MSAYVAFIRPYLLLVRATIVHVLAPIVAAGFLVIVIIPIFVVAPVLAVVDGPPNLQRCSYPLSCRQTTSLIFQPARRDTGDHPEL